MATIKDVAEWAGVSIGTVDRIIHNRGRFSQKTAKRVKQAIKDLDYKTNIQARNLSLSKKCHIAVLMPFTEQDSSYWQLPYNGMQTALNELASSHVTADFFHYDRYDKNTLFDAVSKMMKEEYDAYVAAPLIPDAFLNIYKEIFESKPVVYFDTDIEDSKRLLYVGQDSLDAGHLAAKLITLLCAGKDKRVLVVTPETENNEHLRYRIEGFTERINVQYDLVSLPVDEDYALQLYNDIRKKLGTVYMAVYVIDSSSHRIARLIEEEGIKDSVALIGYDLVKKNIEYTRNGTIDFILTQRPFEQGHLSIKSLYQKVILGSTIANRYYMPIDIITRENIDSYIESLKVQI